MNVIEFNYCFHAIDSYWKMVDKWKNIATSWWVRTPLFDLDLEFTNLTKGYFRMTSLISLVIFLVCSKEIVCGDMDIAN